MSDIVDRLRDYGGNPMLRSPYAMAMHEAADEIERLRAELELRRKSGSAIDRLHNLCESIASDADGSEFSSEEWDRIDAENVALRAEVERLKAERDHARARLDRSIQILTRIHGLLYPPPVTLPDGRTMALRLEDLNANDVLQKLSDRIRAIPDELDAAAAQEPR